MHRFRQCRIIPLSIANRRSISSPELCVFWLHSLLTLANDPLAHIERTLDQFNAVVFAANQEPYYLQVHQGDFAEVQNFTLAIFVHRRLNRGDVVRLNPSTQSQPLYASP